MLFCFWYAGDVVSRVVLGRGLGSTSVSTCYIPLVGVDVQSTPVLCTGIKCLHIDPDKKFNIALNALSLVSSGV